jgi:hypothetical protein
MLTVTTHWWELTSKCRSSVREMHRRPRGDITMRPILLNWRMHHLTLLSPRP